MSFMSKVYVMYCSVISSKLKTCQSRFHQGNLTVAFGAILVCCEVSRKTSLPVYQTVRRQTVSPQSFTNSAV